MGHNGERSFSQPDLSSYFDKSVAAVREYSGRFEQSYGTPAVNYATSSFEVYPVLSMFIGIFASLSFLPVITFIGLSIFFITLFTVLALSCALIAIVFVELGMLSFLAIVLAASFFFTIPLTGVAVFTYLFARFFLHIRSDGREGVSHWIDETRRHFIQSDGPVLRERHDELDPFARKPTPTAKPATPVSSLKANHIVVEE